MIAIIGAGTMGKSIAIEFARFNHKVVLVSAQRHLSTEMLEQEVQRLADKYNFENKTQILENIITTNKYDLISDCDIIVEAVSENLSNKRFIVQEFIRYVKTGTIIASNTSSLSIQDIFVGLTDLKYVIGLHFFNPVQVMKLVELSYIDSTSQETISIARKIVCDIEKEVVLVKNSPGFIVNRLLIPMINEASKIYEEGIASIEDIDRAMKFGANHPMGPLKLSDLIGNDITLAILEILKLKEPNLLISKTLSDYVKEKKLGRKTKIGFYDYNK